ncbi:MAG: CAP domain-containing protein [Solirubrobacteraceae bacterium]
MLRTRTALIPALLAAASLGLAGCGSASAPSAPASGPAAPGPAGSLSIGVTGGHLGDAVTDTSGGGLRELSPGGPIDPAAQRRRPNLREGIGAGDACPNATLMPSATNVATVAEATLCLLNGERADRGLTPLSLNDRLQRAALGHGNDMVEHRYFAHEGRDGSQPAERIRAAGYLSAGGAWRIGENLAWGTGDLATPTAIMAAWMASAGHRANILQPAYREIGFGVLAGNPAAPENGGATFVTEFGFVDRPQRTASTRSAVTRRVAARARQGRAHTRRTRSHAKARRARARRARAALAPRSRRGRIVGSVASVRHSLN